MPDSRETRLTADLRRDNNEREWRLHGASLADITFLRRRGFIVYRDGRRYRVDDKHLTRAGMTALVRRERHLIKYANGVK
jgi:hypothetical protein